MRRRGSRVKVSTAVNHTSEQRPLSPRGQKPSRLSPDPETALTNICFAVMKDILRSELHIVLYPYGYTCIVLCLNTYVFTG